MRPVVLRRPFGVSTGNTLQTVSNQLLAALPSRDLDRLRRHLVVRSFEVRHVLYNPGDPIRSVYFPGDGFCSVLTVLADGTMVEVATIGSDGMVGVNAMLNGVPSTALTMVQGEIRTCYEMAVEDFRTEMIARGALFELAGRYYEAFTGVIMQSTACNAVHSIEQRLSRWLLMARDRMASDEFPLTPEFVAMMLGASRPSVTIVAGTLQNAGLIKYRRGHVTVIDREGLEAASCECYHTATELLRRTTAGFRRT
jgi:CRP-like cAMP-binding protein